MPLEHNASHLGDVAGSSPLSMASRVAIAVNTRPRRCSSSAAARWPTSPRRARRAESVVKAGGAALVCRAMQNNPSAQLQRQGCAALADLAGDEAFDVVAQGDGIGRGRGHGGAPGRRRGAGGGLLGRQPRVRRSQDAHRAHAGGGPQLVCKAMEAHLADGTSTEGCCVVTCWGEVQKQGCGRRADGVVRRRARAPQVRRRGRVGGKALHNLACNNDAMRTALLKQSAIKLMLDAQVHRTRAACSSRAASRWPRSLKRMRPVGGCQEGRRPQLVGRDAASQEVLRTEVGHKGLLAITPSGYNQATQKYERKY